MREKCSRLSISRYRCKVSAKEQRMQNSVVGCFKPYCRGKTQVSALRVENAVLTSVRKRTFFAELPSFLFSGFFRLCDTVRKSKTTLETWITLHMELHF